MQRSSARQREFDFGDVAAASSPEHSQQPPVVRSTPNIAGADSSRNVFESAFQPSGAVVAATARAAGRLNATTISQVEYDRLLQERTALVSKKLDGTISRQEDNRLQYVRWSLDRIEDARTGASLDTLESLVRQHEEILLNIQRLQEQMVEARSDRLKNDAANARRRR